MATRVVVFVSDHATRWHAPIWKKLKRWGVIDKFPKDPNLSHVTATMLNTERPVLQNGTVLFCALRPNYCQFLNSVCLRVFEWDSLSVQDHASVCLWVCLHVLCVWMHMTAITISSEPETGYSLSLAYSWQVGQPITVCLWMDGERVDVREPEILMFL